MDEDYKRFCMKCGWNDEDYGCTSPRNEAVFQCPMYMYYHPEEVEQFEKDMEEWAKQREKEAEQISNTPMEIQNEIRDARMLELIKAQGVMQNEHF